MVYKVSMKGTRFIGCSGYPKCKHIEWIKTISDKSVKCPDCEEGYIVEKTFVDKKTKKKKSMYGCSEYPVCTHIMDEKNIQRNKIEV